MKFQETETYYENLPKIYGKKEHPKPLFQTLMTHISETDLRFKQLRLEMAGTQLHEAKLQLLQTSIDTPKTQEDWARITAIMCQALELVLNHIRNQQLTSRDRYCESDAPLTLTPKQIEMISMLAKGMSNKKIAQENRIKETTVNQSLSRIYKTLGVKSRTQAVAVCIDRGII